MGGTNGSLFVFGGSSVARGHLLAGAVLPPTPISFNLQDGVWTTLHSAPSSLSRQSCAAAAIAGHVYVFGGPANGCEGLSSVDRFDTRAQVWDVLDMPANLHGASVATVVAS